MGSHPGRRGGIRAFLGLAIVVAGTVGAGGDDVARDNRGAWLRCGRGDEIDWLAIRLKLAGYADKYLDAPHIFIEEARLAYVYAHKPLMLAEGACPLGDISLRLFMWVFVEDDRLLQAVEATPGYSSPDGDYDGLQPAAMLAEALRAFWTLPLSWSEVFGSGWPLFSILGQLSQKARRQLTEVGDFRRFEDDCQDVAIWGDKSYLAALQQSFQSGANLPAHASLSALLAVDRTACPFAFASALLAMADSIRFDSIDAGLGDQGGRNAFYYRYAATPPIAAKSAMSRDLAKHVGATYADDVEALVGQAEHAVRGTGSPGKNPASGGTAAKGAGRAWPASLLLTPWPFWRLLDRLSCSEWVEVKTRPLASASSVLSRRLRSASPTFFMHVFPHRVSSDGLQSSRTRASRQAYCAKEFQHEFDAMRLRFPGKPLRMVEAGPHLGDCLLWAAARVGCAGALRGTGYDVIHQLVALTRKSILRNGMEECLEARLAALSEAGAASPSSYAGVPSVALDEQLSEVPEFVHVIKVHTNGLEDAILRGGRRQFAEPGRGVGVVVVNSCSAEVLERVVEFLDSLGSPGYELELRGEPLEGGPKEVAEAFRAALGVTGSVQLVARRADLPAAVAGNSTAPLGPPPSQRR
mmetsp:Transcript_27272/g.61295  ORF Transcript_27272/g.61295 Transcript_27272/m.61295 type:complete len:638 (+) Transcript_27272:54-1967(+)